MLLERSPCYCIQEHHIAGFMLGDFPEKIPLFCFFPRMCSLFSFFPDSVCIFSNPVNTVAFAPSASPALPHSSRRRLRPMLPLWGLATSMRRPSLPVVLVGYVGLPHTCGWKPRMTEMEGLWRVFGGDVALLWAMAPLRATTAQASQIKGTVGEGHCGR